MENRSIAMHSNTAKHLSARINSSALKKALLSQSRGFHEVLDTYSLRENIPLRLDLWTRVVIPQRVSRHWDNLIRRSPILQRALFFLEDDTPTCEGQPVDNPLLKSLFPRCLKDHGHGEERSLPGRLGYDKQLLTSPRVHGEGCSCNRIHRERPESVVHWRRDLPKFRQMQPGRR